MVTGRAFKNAKAQAENLSVGTFDARLIEAANTIEELRRILDVIRHREVTDHETVLAIDAILKLLDS